MSTADRRRLPERRISIRETVHFVFPSRVEMVFDVTFGLDGQGRVREVFCAGAHTRSDLQGVIEDGCIAASIALQRGHSIAELARSFGELREDGAASGPPVSPLGAIARAGACLEAALAKEASP